MTRPVVLAGAAALLGAVLYLNSLPNELVFDDRLVIERNEQIRSLGSLPEIFRTPYHYGYQHGNTGLYRPLTLCTFSLNYAMGDLRPPGYHAVNVLLHSLASALVVLLGLALGLAGPAALAGGLLFAAHPVHTEAVANLAGRAELLAAVFFLLALLTYLRGRGTSPKWGFWGQDSDPRLLAVSAGFLFLALLSKENALTFLGVAIAWELLMRPPARKDAALALAWLLVPVAAYLALRQVALGAALGPPLGVEFIDNPLVETGLLARWATALAVAARYLGLLLLPWKLSPDYSYAQIVPVTTPWNGAFLLGLLALSVAAALLARGVRRYRCEAFLALFCVITFSIVSNIPAVIGTIMAERLLYLPSAGFCLLVGCAWPRLCSRVRPALAIVLAVTVVAAASVRTVARNLDWRDGYTLFSKAAVTSPRSAKVLNNLGAELLRRGQVEEARQVLERAMSIAPGWANVRINLAQVHLDEGNLERAEEEAREAVKRLPGDGLPLFKLAEVLENRGRWEEAAGVLGQGLALEPRDWEARLRRGIVLQALGDLAGAERELDGVVQAQPRSAKARNALGLLHLRMGAQEKAVEDLRHAVEIDPGSVPVRNNLGNALREAGETDEAIRELQQTLSMDESFPATHYNLGLALEKAGRIEEARRQYERAIEIEPSHAGALRSLGRLALRSGDPEAAIRSLDPALSVEGTSEEGHALRARASFLLERYAEAERGYRRVLELNPRSVAAHNNLGVIYALRGDKAAARREWEEALRLAPGAKEIEENLRRLAD